MITVPPSPRGRTPLPFLAAVAPWLLHHAAARASVLGSLICGIVAGQIAILIVHQALSALGPRNVLDILSVIAALAISTLMLVFLFMPGQVWIRLSLRGRACLCAVLLSPATLLVPLLLWLFLVELIRANHGPLILTPTGLVRRAPSPVLALATSPFWLLPIALAVAANLWLAMTRLSRMTFPDDGNICPSCHYSLRGLPAGAPCPECGHTP